MKIRSELRAQVWERDQGRCIWPRCVERADEVMHFHSKGAGGTPDGRRDVLGNLGLGCWDHARMSDGEHGEGGASGYRRAHLDLLGDRFLEMPANVIGWERAEALACIVSTGSIQSGQEV